MVKADPNNEVLDKTLGTNLIPNFEANCFDGYRILKILDGII
jgi:hypothetical protein